MEPEARKCSGLALEHTHIILQWIPALCGVQDNEKADILATKESKIMQKEEQKLLYESIK